MSGTRIVAPINPYFRHVRSIKGEALPAKILSIYWTRTRDFWLRVEEFYPSLHNPVVQLHPSEQIARNGSIYMMQLAEELVYFANLWIGFNFVLC